LWGGPEAVMRELAAMPGPRVPAGPPHTSGRWRSRGVLDPLWRELQRFRGRVPHVWIRVVSYPFFVADPVPPACIVISDRVLLNPQVLRGMLLRSLEVLAKPFAG